LDHSEDLKRLVLALYEASVTGNGAFLNNLVSDDDSVVTIGTAPDEFWMGHSAILQARTSRAQTSSIVAIIPGKIQAFAEGTVGWVVDQPRLRLADGSEIDLRFTAVFHVEQGQWKLVQQHASVGVPD